MIDIDSFVGEVHGHAKQGAGYGYTRQLGYHPLLATRADTSEVLHVRLRKGAANTQRGALRFVDDLLARVRKAGAAGPASSAAPAPFVLVSNIPASLRSRPQSSLFPRW